MHPSARSTCATRLALLLVEVGRGGWPLLWVTPGDGVRATRPEPTDLVRANETVLDISREPPPDGSDSQLALLGVKECVRGGSAALSDAGERTGKEEPRAND